MWKIRNHDNLDYDFLRRTERFHLFALGIAQHYGLPSVGLDLTDDVKVALWFAIYKAIYSSTAPVEAELIEPECNTANIYVFRCPKDTIFKYRDLVGEIGTHRPDVQNAYFNYCGWGSAQNMLAMHLACVFRVDNTFNKFLPHNYVRILFPSKDDDEILRILLQIKVRYRGTELGRILEKIYL